MSLTGFDLFNCEPRPDKLVRVSEIAGVSKVVAAKLWWFAMRTTLCLGFERQEDANACFYCTTGKR